MQTELATLPSSLATAYHPGNVYTVSEARPRAEVFLVSADGLFSAAGTNAEILQLAREQGIPTVDLRSQFVMPGIHDAHVHCDREASMKKGPNNNDLRFRAPQSPIENRTVVQTGTGTRIGPQGQPQWQAKTLMAIGKYSNPKVPFTLEGWVEAIENGIVPPGNINANATEDCLLLDVHIPKKVLKAAGTKKKESVPVLVFAQSAFNQDFVFVTLNYRLGAFGWFNSAKVLADGDANAALLDQRFVLQWDQDNIHLFGGSKDHVTIMGESGGRSSVLRHLIAAGAKCKSTKKLFQQAISQSPADIPVATSDPDELYGRFLSILKADNLDAAKSILRCHYYC
ncbi:Carboxylesterase patB [Fusarium oxysporum f. sp. cubense]|uniref:Carboxylic ester hydrolase n=1 Tax=Fusarium oxysporum f. sp. cubense TaxID=61366 RepID=A0A559LVW4_FUSOC|nr:Carboxylesterase patB [Fusarium oxysporum f. sp. cubense]